MVDASIQVSVNTPWHMWPWLAITPRLEVQYHSIHYIDAMRSILGDPVWVTSRHARNPLQGDDRRRDQDHHDHGLRRRPAGVDRRQPLQPQRRLLRGLSLSSAPRATSPARWARCTTTPTAARTRWSGAARSIIPTNASRPSWRGKWIPDAFIGPTASLMQAIQEDGVPETDGYDNLQTLRVVEAAYLSQPPRTAPSTWTSARRAVPGLRPRIAHGSTSRLARIDLRGSLPHFVSPRSSRDARRSCHPRLWRRISGHQRVLCRDGSA